jgi:hypothetical protein
MPLKDHNLGSAQPAIPKNWDSETRFVKYEYGPLYVGSTSVPQEPSARPSHSQPLKGISLGAFQAITANEERDFRIANARRGENRSGSSLEKLAKSTGCDLCATKPYLMNAQRKNLMP